MIPRASLALDNLRALVILLVLRSFPFWPTWISCLPRHSRSTTLPFGAFPVVDHERWFGFDLFCAWQDVFLISLFFSSPACSYGRAAAQGSPDISP
jgi:hypothetical protein